jgi:pSer/pThr/pTyr-binding forkhead associated (FHA) protein
MIRETPLERFRKACGLAAPIALTYQAQDAPDAALLQFDSPAPFLLIGRSPTDDLTLDSRQVSRRHAYLQAVAGRVIGIDLKSRTSTFWDDWSEAQPWGWLDPEHSIRIGPYRIQLADRPSDGPPPLLDPFSPANDPESVAAPFPRPVLELPFRVGGVASTWEMAGLLALVGRADDCQLILADDSISRTHASLVRTPQGAWVVDLGAREGVHVNGTRVRWAWLADGDLVRLGRFTMVLRYDRPPEGISREDVPLEAGATMADSSDDGEQAEDQPTEGGGRGLALRPTARPPGLRKAPVPAHDFTSAVPAAVDRTEWEPAFGPGPNPYAMWQQQMQLMESFHNDMAMMVQMFIAMHREFQGSVRDELERVQQLTRELNRLNARLGEIPEAAETGPATPAKRPEGRPGTGRKEDRPRRSATTHPRTAHRADVPTGRPPKDPGADPGHRGRSAPIPEDPAKAGAAPGPRKESSEMYADLTQRITELQRERRGYWQRILKNING